MLGDIVREAGTRFGSRDALVTPSDTVSYEDLDRSADRLAAGLAGRGIRTGDVIATVLPSCAEWLVLAVAADRVGAILAPVSPKLAAPERAELVALIAPRLVVADRAGVEGLPLRTEVAVLEPGDRGEPLWGGADLPPRPAASDDRVTTICFTSGTTGRAKGAVFTVAHQRAVQALDLGPEAEATWGGGSSMLASTQLAHVGMALKLPWYLRTGATLRVLDPWRADDALRLVAEHRMPTIGVVAPQLALMLRSPLVDELDLSSVAAIIAGGAASPPALVREARERFGAAYSIRYSSTESGGVGLGTAFDAPDDEALHTIGRPRAGIEARVADEDDAPLPDGATGELQIRSPAVMAGYWDDPDATAAALTHDRWLRTGDLAQRRDDGCYVLAGRRTDMYIRGGYNVFPEEVEAALSDHPAVAALAISPRPDDVMGEVGVAVVVARDPEAPPSLEGLRAHGEARLARHKLPEDVVVVDRLPLTTVSKLDRGALATLVRDARDGRSR
ncbi:class I adenylate-forming enzyme family protein [Dermatobacter hominis]|uniref:class I adenylate-forming enzyme family protein n=1 Tax=Dermatobacter hominis TaxID=2884263 RepID=UPI001D1204F0|nr:class I adenylate-forming enzyme family protein [Dermatobacter hominis]UDY37846.1 acyl--CoA ligase [Dermatobacter hominis]